MKHQLKHFAIVFLLGLSINFLLDTLQRSIAAPLYVYVLEIAVVTLILWWNWDRINSWVGDIAPKPHKDKVSK